MTPEKARAELAAYDHLSCRCALDQECHVDEHIEAIHCEHRLRDGRRCPDCDKMLTD